MDPIVLGKAAIMGLVEGATEFIPVSSTGHLILADDWIGFGESVGETSAETFTVVIQLGAILAVVWFYRRLLLDVARNWMREPKERRFLWNLFLAFAPSVVIGLLAYDFIKDRLFSERVVAASLVLGGIGILLIERWKPRPTTGTVAEMRPRTALGVGLAQVVSMIPGVSRSGATIMGGIALGVSRVAATEFSFFLAIPTMLGATVLDLYKARDVLTAADAPVFAVGMIVSFVSALLVVKALLRFVAAHDFRPFAWYRIVFGALLLVWYWR